MCTQCTLYSSSVHIFCCFYLTTLFYRYNKKRAYNCRNTRTTASFSFFYKEGKLEGDSGTCPLKIWFFLYSRLPRLFLLLKGLWSGKKNFVKSWAILLGAFFISFSGSVIVFSGPVIDTADSYMLQQFHNCFRVSVK